MGKDWFRNGIVAVGILCVALVANAQTPPDRTNPFGDFVTDEELRQSLRQPPQVVPPEVRDSAELYRELILPDRCPPHYTVRRRVPCSVIDEGGQYRPVFLVESPERIVTLIGGRFSEVTVSDLARAWQFEDGDTQKTSGAVTGYTENQKACAAHAPSCIPASVFLAYAQDRKTISSACADQVWGLLLSVPDGVVVITARCDFFIPG